MSKPTLTQVLEIKHANARRIAKLKEKVAEAYRIAARISGEKLLDLPGAKQLQFAYAMDRWRKIRAILEDDRNFLWSSIYIQESNFAMLEALGVNTFPEERKNCVELEPLSEGEVQLLRKRMKASFEKLQNLLRATRSPA
jgi:hypothetical protein